MSKSEPAPAGGRACRYCGGPIPASKRKHAVYCSPQCRDAQWREDNAEKKAAYDKNWREDNAEKKAAYYKKSYVDLKKEAQSGTPKGILAHKRKMLNSAKTRAAKKNLPFNLTLDDFELPATCPVLGTEIFLGTDYASRDQAPSLDRVIPALGYVKGNVIVTSFRANRIKNDATVPELEAVAAFYRNHLQNDWMKSHD